MADHNTLPRWIKRIKGPVDNQSMVSSIKEMLMVCKNGQTAIMLTIIFDNNMKAITQHNVQENRENGFPMLIHFVYHCTPNTTDLGACLISHL